VLTPEEIAGRLAVAGPPSYLTSPHAAVVGVGETRAALQPDPRRVRA
jgi:hypothetical protein